MTFSNHTDCENRPTRIKNYLMKRTLSRSIQYLQMFRVWAKLGIGRPYVMETLKNHMIFAFMLIIRSLVGLLE